MIEKSHAKVNIFLKMLGTRGSYHTLSSRFMQVETLFDTLSFEKKTDHSKEFILEGNFGCKQNKNTIYKAFIALLKENSNTKMINFFHDYKVVVEKNIPEFAGLGGGSSNAAAFLRLSNRTLNLGHSSDTLAKIGATIGADVPFFVYNYPSANVSGIGEVVMPFHEERLDIEVFTPDILCDTGKVYQRFREVYLKDIDSHSALALDNISSKELLETYDALFLNDLFSPALDLYPKLETYHQRASLPLGYNNFFSGSGSTFFKVNHG